MTSYLCTACGTQFPSSPTPPAACPICQDERQFVPPSGQGWVSFETMRRTHRAIAAYDGEFLGLGMTPHFAIGQRALLVRTPAGNVLWDMIPLIDRALVEIVRGLGGLAAIVISHPHFYSTMAEWSAAFDVPVHVHARDRDWVMNLGEHVRTWEGDRFDLLPGATLIRCGGHFAGGTVMHLPMAHEGRGALLSGDILHVTPGCDGLGFMRGYPNFVPLGEAAVGRIAAALEGVGFDAVYGAFWDRVIASDGRAVLRRSVDRHVAFLRSDEEA
ncbi:MBL fold metallo-hydrolase [Jiella mangrovi]|uniref:MBL fold metallo-hydrolase n=1 Tax=Jiella mangrovi TaxID=2821407 RepID=A0ABS4BI86_9HYPH|nr:MBL fold metallo-hydrolase [Jiella mangrovi]MBP0616470.1 MBL fold metallo-hydrolase [Jiella mangrovi]